MNKGYRYYRDAEEARAFNPVFPMQLTGDEFDAEYCLNCDMPGQADNFDDLIAMENAFTTLEY